MLDPELDYRPVVGYINICPYVSLFTGDLFCEKCNQSFHLGAESKLFDLLDHKPNQARYNVSHYQYNIKYMYNTPCTNLLHKLGVIK